MIGKRASIYNQRKFQSPVFDYAVNLANILFPCSFSYFSVAVFAAESGEGVPELFQAESGERSRNGDYS